MTYSNYSLEIVSHHPQFNGKTLKPYHVEGIDTIGVWGNEQFEIVFRNNSLMKVQVKLSLDGTDLLTGLPADTQPSEKMFVVNGLSSLTLKAWAEDMNGGAAFVFTSADNSVAAHTHGNISSRGIIAAAVFTEGHVEPVRTWDHYWGGWYGGWYYNPWQYPFILTNDPNRQPTIYDGGFYTTYTTNTTNTINTYPANGSYSSNGITSDMSGSAVVGNSIQNQPGVGAGRYVEQHLTTVAGLTKPLLSETIRVKYEWWDNLVAKLRAQTVVQPQPSGFPADKKTGINLGSTPRIDALHNPPAAKPFEQVFTRV